MKMNKTYFYKIYGSQRIAYTEILLLHRYASIIDADEIYTYKELINILNNNNADVYIPDYVSDDSVSFLYTDNKIYVSQNQFKITHNMGYTSNENV